MATVTSASNPLLQDVRRAIGRGTLTDQGWCVAEGFHLLEEARRSGCRIEAILSSGTSNVKCEGVRVICLPDRLFRTISSTEKSQGVITLVHPPKWCKEQILSATPLVLVLDGVQDPGNAGTMVRTAEAFGATGVVFMKGSVNPYNPKALRASAGSIFRLPLLASVDPAEFIESARAGGLAIYAAVPRAGQPPGCCDFSRPVALITGSEGQGIGASLLAESSLVSIPTAGVESLNAGVAAAILLYEARRQRIGTRRKP